LHGHGTDTHDTIADRMEHQDTPSERGRQHDVSTERAGNDRTTHPCSRGRPSPCLRREAWQSDEDRDHEYDIERVRLDATGIEDRDRADDERHREKQGYRASEAQTAQPEIHARRGHATREERHVGKPSHITEEHIMEEPQCDREARVRGSRDDQLRGREVNCAGGNPRIVEPQRRCRKRDAPDGIADDEHCDDNGNAEPPTIQGRAETVRPAFDE
jgi:hypothetical protein